MSFTPSYGRKPTTKPFANVAKLHKDLLTRVRAAFTPAYSYAYRMPPIFDQLSFSDCVSNAWTAWFMFFARIREKNYNVFSRSANYEAAKVLEGEVPQQDDGLEVPSGGTVCETKGYVLETLRPYPKDGDVAALLSPVQQTQWTTTFLVKKFISIPTDPASLELGLLKHGPLIAGLNFPYEWENCGPDGRLVSNPQTLAGGHCVLIDEFDRRFLNLDETKGMVAIRNSWGLYWGKNGRGFAPYSASNSQFWFEECYAGTV